MGRLDAESEGLILLTDDGALNQRMTHPKYACCKTYLAVARGYGRPGSRRRVREEMVARCVDEGVVLRQASAAPYRCQPVAMALLSYDEAEAAMGGVGGMACLLKDLVDVNVSVDVGVGVGVGPSATLPNQAEVESSSRREPHADRTIGDGTAEHLAGHLAEHLAEASEAAELDFVRVTLTEGKRHEVRMLLKSGLGSGSYAGSDEALGFGTLRLVRTQHGPFDDAGLLARPGAWREARREEVLEALEGRPGAA